MALLDIFRRIPAAGIRINSRGEAVLRLRGSEERQTGIFLDGAPLSVPWDGRVDLSAIPAGIVDRVSVVASAAPIEYGANSALGVVQLSTPLESHSGLISAQAELGSQDSGSLSAVGGTQTGQADWLFGGSMRALGGEAVSSKSVIPYGPTQDGARVNTDLDSASLFVSLSTQPRWGAVKASLFSVAADRGIANAGHINPSDGSPRYWRYPDWRFNQLTVNSAVRIDDATSLRSTLWLQHFEQTIDQFLDDSYAVVESSENDVDRTLGMRMVLERAFDAIDARIVGNAQVTTHDQIDSDRLNEVRGPVQSFQQNVYSLGAEIDSAPHHEVRLSAGMSYDLAATPRTGGRDAQDEFSSWSANVAARWYPADRWQIVGTLGRRTRFPSLRELYGEALGEFVLNPDLQPETVMLADLTIESSWHDEQVRVRLTPWWLRIDETLSRRVIEVEGTRYRQRYNLNGSSGRGLEAGIDWQFADRLEVRLHGNWQDLEALPESDGTRAMLYQRPEIQGSVSIDYLFAADWDLFIEAQYVGKALDEDEAGNTVSLPTSTEVNLRLFKTIRQEDAGRWRAYCGVDNLGNAVVLPQLGLPLPGRTISIGVSFERN